jgi:hypothetical protein
MPTRLTISSLFPAVGVPTTMVGFPAVLQTQNVLILILMLKIPVGVCIQGIYFNSSEKNHSQSTLSSALLKIIW